mgnify:CR=1 FL=1
MMLNLEVVNTILLIFVIVLVLGLLMRSVLEKFQDTCNPSSTGVNNIHGCTGDNPGSIVKVGTNTYMCGQTDGYAFPCL